VGRNARVVSGDSQESSQGKRRSPAGIVNRYLKDMELASPEIES
jgi:hypothetical protein